MSRADIEQRDARRRRRVRQTWIAGLSTVFAVLLGLTIWALFEREHAMARQLAAQAALPTGLDRELVERRVLLALESSRRLARLDKPTIDADSALREALSQMPRRKFMLPGGQRGIAFAADGQHLLK